MRARLASADFLSLAAIPTEPSIPAGYAREVVELCVELGVPREVLARDLALDLESLSDPSVRLSIPACEALVVTARRLTGQDGLAMLLGLRMRASQHGFLGFAAMTAATVRDALVLAERYCVTRTTALSLTLFEEGEVASLVIEERAKLGELREFAVLSLVVGLQQIGVVLTGQLLPGRAECAFAQPRYLAGVLDSRADLLRFSCPSHRLVFARELLATSLVTADPVATALARSQCDRELAALASTGSFPARVRAAIERQPPGSAKLEGVAAELHVSERTLERHLAQHGTSFSTVLDTSRRERALLLIEDRGLPIAEVGWRVGYTDTANFTRAFRRWTGMTPGAYRGR